MRAVSCRLTLCSGGQPAHRLSAWPSNFHGFRLGTSPATFSTSVVCTGLPLWPHAGRTAGTYNGCGCASCLQECCRRHLGEYVHTDSVSPHSLAKPWHADMQCGIQGISLGTSPATSSPSVTPWSAVAALSNAAQPSHQPDAPARGPAVRRDAGHVQHGQAAVVVRDCGDDHTSIHTRQPVRNVAQQPLRCEKTHAMMGMLLRFLHDPNHISPHPGHQENVVHSWCPALWEHAHGHRHWALGGMSWRGMISVVSGRSCAGQRRTAVTLCRRSRLVAAAATPLGFVAEPN